jgi:hypothetical protein
MKIRLLVLVLCFPFCSMGQTFDWWKNLVNWDGTTYWWNYLTISPKYLGPNALTIPAINNGSIDSSTHLGVTGNFHFSKGDNTQNIVLYGNYAPRNTRISIDAQFVPYERFRMSHAVKEQRKVYYKDYYDKATVGDVVVNTTIQLFQNWRSRFQLALRVGMRMPSGGSQGAARYADVPGYWIDLGGALPWKQGQWKWINMLGFFVWQTNKDDRFKQDDALLCGTGLEFNKNGFRMQHYLAAYFGYQENGDDPVVYRFNVEKKVNKRSWIFRYQQGLQDFNYSSFELGAKFYLGK